MRKFLQQATLAASMALAATTAETGCSVPKFPDAIHLSRQPDSQAEKPDRSLEDLLALCREQHRELMDCMHDSHELGIKMAHQHLKDLPDLENGRIPQEWIDLREKAMKNIEEMQKADESFKVEFNKDGRITRIIILGEPFTFEQPFDVGLFDRVLGHLNYSRHLRLTMEMSRNKIKSPADFRVHDLELIEFTAMDEQGRRNNYCYISGDLAQVKNKIDTTIQMKSITEADKVYAATPNDRGQWEISEYDGNEPAAIIIAASPVMTIKVASLGSNNLLLKTTKLLLPDDVVETTSYRAVHGSSSVHPDVINGSLELNDHEWKPSEVRFDFAHENFYLNDKGRVEEKDYEKHLYERHPAGNEDILETIVTYCDPITEKPVFERTKRSPYTRQGEEHWKRSWLIGENGSRIGAYSVEKARNPDLTADKWLDSLAGIITMPAHWQHLALFMDSRDYYAKHDKLKKEKKEKEWEKIRDEYDKFWWKSIAQGLEKKDFYTDILDQAAFVQEILRRQGLHAHIVHVPETGYGYSAVWVTRRPDQRLDVNYVGDKGIGRNGIFYTNDPDKYAASKGFRDIPEIVSAACKKNDLLRSVMAKYHVSCDDRTGIEYGLKLWNGEVPVYPMPITEKQVPAWIPFGEFYNGTGSL